MSEPTPFALRPVGEAQLDELVILYQGCADFLRLASAAPVDAAMVLADLELSRSEGGRFHGIYVGDRLVGVADYTGPGYEGKPDYAFLLLLMLERSWRGQGLGAAVVRQIEARIWADPRVRVLGSAVQVDNPGAVAFWDRMGYARVSGPTRQPDGTTTYLLAKRRPREG